ncbi:MAG: hypothetical protein IPL40_14705 [Proteobacteria bacterium]|nr:hypothetical protein [Pseudomonadota bacterium]
MKGPGSEAIVPTFTATLETAEGATRSTRSFRELAYTDGWKTIRARVAARQVVFQIGEAQLPPVPVSLGIVRAYLGQGYARAGALPRPPRRSIARLLW